MTMTNPLAPSTTPPVDFSTALSQCRPLFQEIHEPDYAPLNVDITASCTMVLGRVANILSLRAQVVEELPKFDITHFDTLEVKTKAAIQAHFNHLLASASPAEIPLLDARLNRFRSLFIADINTLANRGLIDNTKLGELKSPNGHKNLAESVSALVAHLRRNWTVIQARTGVTQQEVAEADETAQRMIITLANQAAPLPPTEAAIERRQAYTLFTRSYDEVRRVVTYLRTPFDDVQDFAPSVRAVIKSDRSESKTRDEEPEASAPSVVPLVGGAVTAGIQGLPNSNPISG